MPGEKILKHETLLKGRAQQLVCGRVFNIDRKLNKQDRTVTRMDW
jgi:hypothetical protein